MSSFFTTPASQKKRKRTEGSRPSAQKRRNLTSTDARRPPSSKKRRIRDESVSGSESEDDAPRNPQEEEDSEGSDESDVENENPAERCLRLAEQYLENIREEVDEVGYDAADIDRDLIAERLKEDVAETKGKLHKHIADKLDWGQAKSAKMAWGGHASTGIAHGKSVDGEHDYLYTVSKDNVVVKWEVPKPYIQGTSTHTRFDDDDGHASTTSSSIAHAPSTNGASSGHTTQSTKRSRAPRKLAHFACRRPPPSATPLAPGVTLHTGKILCVAAAPSGRYIATGSSEKRIVIWAVGAPGELVPIKTFLQQHRDAVLALSFRMPPGGKHRPRTGSNISGGGSQMFSASADRTVKIWDLDAMAYVETLFGHQDAVVDVVGCAGERCVSVGARDRTARFWKVVEENQLVFRGGGMAKSRGDDVRTSASNRVGKTEATVGNGMDIKGYAEGSIDRVALVDEETFVTGSDNGSISLWNIHKKKAVFSVPLAHGLDPPMSREEALAEDTSLMEAGGGAAEKWEPPPQQPRWITGLTTLPYSDVIVSASWDGCLRAWKVTEDKRRIEGMGVVGMIDERSTNSTDSVLESMNGEHVNGIHHETDVEGKKLVRGIVNDLVVFERGERGKDGLYIAAAVGKEHRLGRWKKANASNCAVVFEVPLKERQVDVMVNGSS